MLTFKPVGKASDASLYFAQDNYYTKEQGIEHSEWNGRGAEILGQEGKINAEVFEKLLTGVINEQQLGNVKGGVRRHRPGYDFTFSAPKSVSILSEVYGVKAVEVAHANAVKAALGYVESELIQYRSTSNGTTRSLKADNAIFASFTHDVSRELDPQLHTHNILMNATHNGFEWQSITVEKAFRNTKLVGAVYRNELGRQLQDLGYTLNRQHGDKTLFEVDGIPPEMMEEFSKRTAQIKAYFKDNSLEYDPKLAKRIALLTRRKKETLSREELRNLWAITTDNYDIPKPLLSPKGMPGKAVPTKQVLDQAIAHLSERNSAFTRKETLDSALMLNSRASAKELLEKLEKRISKGVLIMAPDHPDPSNKDEYFTTREMVEMEREIEKTLARDKGRFKVFVDDKAIDKAFKKTHLNDQQQAAVRKSLASNDRFFGIQGDAGVGKTTLLKEYKTLLVKQGYTVTGMAPSYQAVSELSDSLAIKGVVVDRFLVDKSMHVKRPGRNSKHVWIVDEASMLSIDKVAALMDQAEKQNARILLVGDHRQLESVGAGRAFRQLQDRGMETVIVDKRLRQKTTELKTAVDHIMKHDYQEALTTLNDIGSIKVEEDESKAIEVAANSWLELDKAEREATEIIAPANEQRKEINAIIRQSLKQDGDIAKDGYNITSLSDKYLTEQQKRLADSYRKGDIVRFEYKSARLSKEFDDTINKGDYFKVVSTNKESNELVLRSHQNSRKVLIVDPSKRGADINGGIMVYEPEKIELSRGDTVRWLDNKNEHKLKRNTELIVERVSDSYIRLKDTDTQRSIRLPRHSESMFHVTHNYSKTAYGVQGKTVKRAIVVASSWRKNTVNQKSLMVGVTRATHEALIITDGIKELKSSLMNRTGKNTVATEKLKDTGLSEKKEISIKKPGVRQGLLRH